MSQQSIASNTDYLQVTPPSLKNDVSPSKRKKEKATPLSASATDSFELTHQAKPAKTVEAPPTQKQGVSVLATTLIALTSLGMGIGSILLARHLNLFELGQQVETKTIKELPEALTNWLNLGANPTEEQIIKAVANLQKEKPDLQQPLAGNSNLDALQTQLTDALQTFTEKNDQLNIAQEALQKQLADHTKLFSDDAALRAKVQIAEQQKQLAEEELSKIQTQVKALEQDLIEQQKLVEQLRKDPTTPIPPQKNRQKERECYFVNLSFLSFVELEKLAKTGNGNEADKTEALATLGWRFKVGKYGAIEDKATSFKYYEQAANRGHLESKLRVAVCHENGCTGLGPKDLRKALECYKEIVASADETTKKSDEFQQVQQSIVKLTKQLAEE
jgi:hypothetical protein